MKHGDRLVDMLKGEIVWVIIRCGIKDVTMRITQTWMLI